MTSNNMKTAADTSRLMSVIATLAIAIALYFGCSFLIWQGSRWADQVGSSGPLLGALAIIIGGLLATAICGKRGTSHEAQAGPWRVALRRVSTAAGPMLALLVVVMIFGIADWWQHDAVNS